MKDRLKNLIQRKIESLKKYALQPNQNTSVISARQAEINEMVEYYNAIESYISCLEDEVGMLSHYNQKQKETIESLTNKLMMHRGEYVVKGELHNFYEFEDNKTAGNIYIKNYEYGWS